jgi:hypothetical protein
MKINNLAIVAFVLSSFTMGLPAQAGVGLLISDHSGNQTLGIVLAAIGLGVAVDGIVSGSATHQCTPQNPCNNISFGSSDSSLNSCLSSAVNCNFGSNTFDMTTVTGQQISGSHVYSAPNPGQILIGLVLLGNDSATDVQLLPVNDEMTKELGLSGAQEVAFNRELPRINLIVNDFSTRVAQPASDLDVHALWETEAKPVLSPDAFTAAEKVAAVYSALISHTSNVSGR